jgi:ABC-type transport system involved in Fe-S cluster assembly fused permease/ATPase subunit
MKHLKISTASKSNLELRHEAKESVKTKKYKSSKIHSENMFDLKENEIEVVEKITDSKILKNIGIGGFSTVKLIYSKSCKCYFAMKIVSFNLFDLY